MGNARPAAITAAAITAAAIVALSAIPLSWQESKASKMREEIVSLKQRRGSAAAIIERFEATQGASAGQLSGSAADTARTVRKLLEHAEAPLSIDVVMDTMMEVMMSQDIIGMIKMFLPFANMSREEYERLLGELDAYEGNGMGKQVLTQMLGMFAPSDNPRESLERLIGLDLEAHAYANLLGQWAATDGEGALAWYREKLEAGLLDGKGINNSPSEILLGELLGNIAKKSPGRAIDLLKELADASERGSANAASRIANSVGRNIRETGNDSDLLRLLEWDKNKKHADSIVRGAMTGATSDGELSEVVAFVDKYMDKDDRERTSLVTNHITYQRREPLAERADQLAAFLPENEAPAAIHQLVGQAFGSESADVARDWVATQPAGEIRDEGFRAIAEQESYREDYLSAMADAEQIGDEASRNNAIDNIGRQWMRSDREAARSALPAEVFERIGEASSGIPSQLDASHIESID